VGGRAAWLGSQIYALFFDSGVNNGVRTVSENLGFSSIESAPYKFKVRIIAAFKSRFVIVKIGDAAYTRLASFKNYGLRPTFIWG